MCCRASSCAGGGGKQARRLGLPLDIKGLPGTELLSSREAELCTVCRMLPVHFIAVKEALMRRCLADGALGRSTAQTLFKQVDGGKLMRIYDLLLAQGCVREAPASAGDAAGPSGAGGGGGGCGGGGRREEGAADAEGSCAGGSDVGAGGGSRGGEGSARASGGSDREYGKAHAVDAMLTTPPGEHKGKGAMS